MIIGEGIRRATVLEAHKNKCFVCGRGARRRQPLIAFLHDDPLAHSLSVDAETGKPKQVWRAACRRCWGIATGLTRAARGLLTKIEHRKQLQVFGPRPPRKPRNDERNTTP